MPLWGDKGESTGRRTATRKELVVGKKRSLSQKKIRRRRTLLRCRKLGRGSPLLKVAAFAKEKTDPERGKKRDGRSNGKLHESKGGTILSRRTKKGNSFPGSGENQTSTINCKKEKSAKSKLQQ